MKVVWTTDTHFDHLKPEQVEQACHEMCALKPEAIFITGDVSEARLLVLHLTIVDKSVDVPVYFVLGNHDFYHGSIGEVREQVRQVCFNSKHLRYLTLETQPVEIKPGTFLMGHDGWYDFRHGLGIPQKFIMSDWIYTDDFAMTVQRFGGQYFVDGPKIIEICQNLAQQAVSHIDRIAPQIPDAKQLVFLTHVPPFLKASRHEGKQSEPAAASVFSCKIIGEKLIEIANRFNNIHVFAGHTHSKADIKIGHNITCQVQKANYGEIRYKLIEL